MIKIATLLGTSRPGNYTGKALAIVQDQLQKMANVEPIEIDPARLQLPFPGQKSETGDEKWLQQAVKKSH